MLLTARGKGGVEGTEGEIKRSRLSGEKSGRRERRR